MVTVDNDGAKQAVLREKATKGDEPSLYSTVIN